MSELDVDEKRLKAIQSMVEMAEDAKQQGQLEMAAGFYGEAARLVEAHAENAATDMAGEMLRQQAVDYHAQARALKEGRLAPAPSRAAGGAPAASPQGAVGAWEVTWTRGGDEGQPQSAPSSNGAPWEPFAIASQGTGVLYGWRRPAG